MRELRAMVLALVVPLALSCTSATNPGTGSDATSAATPSTSPRAGSAASEPESESGSGSRSGSEPDPRRKAARVPEVPSKKPAALAEELDLAARTLRDADATQAEQRAAGELQ